MSLAAMLSAHDEAALTALASKGLLRRAQRDLEAGNGTITARSDDAATFETDGHTVRIDATGVKAARCTCPASGVCRHVLLAVLMLQTDTGSVDAPEQEAAQVPAANEIVGLDEAALQKFAGADWAPAQKIASQGAEIEDLGGSCLIVPAHGDASVTFIAGQGLAGAVYKGPRTRQRVHVTAAALAVRARAGVTISAAAVVEDDTVLDPAFCEDVCQTIEMAVIGTMSGAAELAADTLFDRAVSARAGAAPRLAAQLRGLSNMAGLAAARDIAFSGTAFVEAAARSYGLSLALKAAPDDAALSGVIARTYRDVDALDLWVLGASRWRTSTGARGLTVHLYDPAAERWYSQVTARAGGKDLGFDPRGAYFGALWGAGSPESLKGTRLRLAQPRVSEDGQISATLAQSATQFDGALEQAALTGMAISDWGTFRAVVAARLGRGLRRIATPVASLILPAGFGALTFDDFAQVYRLSVFDRAGTELDLSLSAENEFAAPALHAARSEILALLVETSAGEDGWVIRPVTAMLKERGAVRVVNLGFETVGRQRTLGARLTGMQDKLRRHGRRTPAEADRLQQMCDEVTASLVDTLSVPANGAAVIARLNSAGFSALAAAATRAFDTRTPGHILAAAYMAAELRMELS